ncbi:MAG: hypothetical protein NZN45_08790 [Rhodovarius sp.]|nr:hypothetical protein [Rhodovarius sp.]
MAQPPHPPQLRPRPSSLLLLGTALPIALLASAALGLAPGAVAALLVFLTGVGFAVFLWWLAARAFALLADPATTPEQLSALRELPMGLPEGTVRAVLALMVGVIGLPLLLFASALGLSDAIAGYVNGIIAGVFGYYFGARAQHPEALAQRRLADALAQEQQAHAALRREAEAAAQAAEARREAAAVATTLASQMAVTELLLQRLGPALPPALMPADPAALLAEARQALVEAREEGAAARAREVSARLAAPDAPWPRLLHAALPALPALPGGALAAVGLLGALSWHLPAPAWRRWQALLLEATEDPALFDAGAISADQALAALAEAPALAEALAPIAAAPDFPARLMALALAREGVAALWADWGSRFACPTAAAQALAAFRRSLLRRIAAADLTPPLLAAVEAALQEAPAALQPLPGHVAEAARLLEATDPPAEESLAARQALLLLLGLMREQHLNPLALPIACPGSLP